MPIDPSDALGSDVELTFPESLPGTEFRLQKYQYYESAEVREETGTDYPEFGLWLRVKTEDGEGFLAAPLQLREELDRLGAAPGDPFAVDHAEKNGNGNWKVTLEEAGESAQERL